MGQLRLLQIGCRRLFNVTIQNVSVFDWGVISGGFKKMSVFDWGGGGLFQGVTRVLIEQK